ncbi:MAG: PAS domain S-box protein [Cytophagaceae bacterium]|nr:PAS domain S-box protein [Cytophagaceae bacterium]
MQGFPNDLWLNNPHPVILIDGVGKLISFNPSAKPILEKWKTGITEFVPTRIKFAVQTCMTENRKIYYEEKTQHQLFQLTLVPSARENHVAIYGMEITSIKYHQEEIKKSELQYRKLVEETSDLIYKTDLQGRFIYANQAVCDLLGIKASEITKYSTLLFMDKSEKAAILEFYRKQLFSGSLEEEYLEYPIITSKGDKLWIAQKSRVCFENNQVSGLQIYARNITLRKITEQELEHSHLRLKSLIEQLNYGILVEDSNRHIRLINQEFCNLFMIPLQPEQLIGADCRDSAEQNKLLFKNPDHFVLRIHKILRDQKNVIGELCEMSDGRILERDYIPLFLNGEYAGHLWQYRDVTSQKNIEEQVRKSEEKYRNVIENMRLGLIEVDTQGIVTKVYDRFCEMTEYQPEDLLNQNAEFLLADASQLEIINTHTQLRMEGKESVYELKIKSKSGRIIWMRISGAPLYDDNKRIIGSLGIHLDITKQKELEIHLQEAKAKAEQSVKIKEQFLANMSHEIRTPMNAIVGISKLLEKTTLDEKQSEFLSAIQTSSKNLLTIINDILDFSKVESNKIELEKIGFSIAEIVKLQRQSMLPKAKEKCIDLEVHLDPSIDEILIGDPVRLNQILLNLINNAIKFTDSGKVQLQINLIQKSALINQIRFTVSDTGIGISEDKLEQIFDSFTQEDSSITRRYGGTGLGLSISQQLASLYGSCIKVKSIKHKGTDFHFDIIFPVGTSEDLPAQTPTSQTPEPLLRGISVMLVEDNEINQYLAKTILESFEMIVHICNHGKEAIEMIQKKIIDIVLMDIQMPVMGGLEAIDIIRNKLQIHTPIIALTANAIMGDEEQYLKAGASGYISKPFEEEELRSILCKHVTANRSQTVIANAPHSKSRPDMYDLRKLQEISKGNRDFVKKMIQLFIDNTPKEIDKMEAAYTAGDFKSVKDIAHSIKPGIDTMGLSQEGKWIREIEHLALNNPEHEALAITIQQIRKNIDLCVDCLKLDPAYAA